MLLELIWKRSLTCSHGARVAITATRPPAVWILKLQTDEAEVAATLARHVFATFSVVDKHPASRARSGFRTSGNRIYGLGTAFHQLCELCCPSVTLCVSATLETWPPRLPAVPAERHLSASLSGALIANHTLLVTVPFLAEVAHLIRLTGTALTNLCCSFHEIRVDGFERFLKFAFTHHRRQNVSDNDPLNRRTATWTLELIAAIL